MSGAERFLIHNLQPPLLGKRREDRNSKAEGVVVREVSLARFNNTVKPRFNVTLVHRSSMVYRSIARNS